MVNLSIKDAKSLFFDRERVHRSVDKAARSVLSRFGAFVRTRARTSIRKRRAISQPGNPPSSHTGLLRSNILFAYEPDTKSVVIGPALLNRATGAPRLLEKGGSASITDRLGRSRTAIYRPRPYMRPAFDIELSKLPGMFAGSVRE